LLWTVSMMTHRAQSAFVFKLVHNIVVAEC